MPDCLRSVDISNSDHMVTAHMMVDVPSALRDHSLNRSGENIQLCLTISKFTNCCDWTYGFLCIVRMDLRYIPSGMRISDYDWLHGIWHQCHKCLDTDRCTCYLYKHDRLDIPSWQRIRVYNLAEHRHSSVDMNTPHGHRDRDTNYWIHTASVGMDFHWMVVVLPVVLCIGNMDLRSNRVDMNMLEYDCWRDKWPIHRKSRCMDSHTCSVCTSNARHNRSWSHIHDGNRDQGRTDYLHSP